VTQVTQRSGAQSPPIQPLKKAVRPGYARSEIAHPTKCVAGPALLSLPGSDRQALATWDRQTLEHLISHLQ
jgi:hypothetical protein